MYIHVHVQVTHFAIVFWKKLAIDHLPLHRFGGKSEH